MESGKNFVVALAFLFLIFAARQLTYSSTNGMTTGILRGIGRTESVSWSAITCPVLHLTTEEPAIELFEQIPTSTTTISSFIAENVTEAAHGKRGNNIYSDRSSYGSTKYVILVACAATAVVIWIIVLIIATYWIHRSCLKKNATFKSVQSETTLPFIDKAKTRASNFKATNAQTKTPSTAETEVQLVLKFRKETLESYYGIVDLALNGAHDVVIFLEDKRKVNFYLNRLISKKLLISMILLRMIAMNEFQAKCCSFNSTRMHSSSNVYLSFGALVPSGLYSFTS